MRHQITEMDEAGITNGNKKRTLSLKDAFLINGSEIIDENARHVKRLLAEKRLMQER